MRSVIHNDKVHEIEVWLRRWCLFTLPIFVPTGIFVTSSYGGLLNRGADEVIVYSFLSLALGGLTALFCFTRIYNCAWLTAVSLTALFYQLPVSRACTVMVAIVSGFEEI